MKQNAQNTPSLPDGYQRLALPWRLILSIALLLHITAVFAAPWSGPRGDSPIASAVVRPFGPYLDAAYLGHGYQFFAPAPGPSHLVRYRLTMPDGSEQRGTFPDLQSQWPRLLYHRHFMLSEKLNGLFPDPTAAPEIRARQLRVFEVVADSYARHLLRAHDAASVKLEFVRHHLPSHQDLVDGRPLSEPRLYETLWSGTFEGN